MPQTYEDLHDVMRRRSNLLRTIEEAKAAEVELAELKPLLISLTADRDPLTIYRDYQAGGYQGFQVVDGEPCFIEGTLGYSFNIMVIRDNRFVGVPVVEADSVKFPRPAIDQAEEVAEEDAPVAYVPATN